MSDTCYYDDPLTCHGELWECETCHQLYCSAHWHETELGRNVECVACERQRKEEAAETGDNLGTVTETFPVLHGVPLRLAITPADIRTHFDGNEKVQQLTDEELMQIGHDVLRGDTLYNAFNEALREEIEEAFGFDPDEEDDD